MSNIKYFMFVNNVKVSVKFDFGKWNHKSLKNANCIYNVKSYVIPLKFVIKFYVAGLLFAEIQLNSFLVTV